MKSLSVRGRSTAAFSVLVLACAAGVSGCKVPGSDSMGSASGAVDCKKLSVADRELEPCCSDNYSCFKGGRNDQKEDIDLKTGDAQNPLIQIEYAPVQYVLKNESSKKDKTRMRDVSPGTLYRQVQMTAINPQQWSKPIEPCYNIVNNEVLAFKPSQNIESRTLGFLLRKEKDGRTLYALLNRSEERVVFDPERGPLCTGMDLNNYEHLRKVSHIARFPDNSSQYTPISMIATAGGDLYMWVANNDAFGPIRLVSNVSEFVYNANPGSDPYGVLAMGSKADLRYFVIYNSGEVQDPLRVDPMYGEPLVGGTLINNAKTVFPRATFTYPQ